MTKNTYKYNLWRDGKIVYKGITNNLDRREQEHRQEGMVFDRIQQVGGISTREGAGAWEDQSLKTYQRNHGGDLPEYNQNNTGK